MGRRAVLGRLDPRASRVWIDRPESGVIYVGVDESQVQNGRIAIGTEDAERLVEQLREAIRMSHLQLVRHPRLLVKKARYHGDKE